MQSSTPILVVEADAGVRALLRLVVGSVVPDLLWTEAGDATGFAMALTERAPLVAVVARELGWADGLGIVAVLRRRFPDCMVILLGQPEPDLIEPDAQPDLHLTHSVRGLSRLGEAVQRALKRQRAARAARLGEQTCDLPVPWLRLDASERVSATNAAARTLLAPREANPLAASRHSAGEAMLGMAFAELVRLETARLAELSVGVPAAARLVAASGTDRERATLCQVHARPIRQAGQAQGFEVVVVPQTTAAAQVASGVASGVANGVDRVDAELMVSLAHDLRQPMLTVIQSANLLRERLRRVASLRPEDERALERIVSGCDRVQDMTERVLQYLAAGKRPLEKAWVDTDALLDEVVQHAAPVIERTGAQIVRSGLPVVYADRSELFQLFQNLLDNALKFHGGRPPVLQVRGEEDSSGWNLVFSDRGVGIDPAEAERIFEPFRRLHSADEVPGTGIGLGVCRQICARHGGRIWAVANTEGGVSFHVQLPRPRENSGMTSGQSPHVTHGGRTGRA
ncbi:MAG: hypothetical protein KDK91_01015 [Gammaproteobacteria bacterium]|nr:hypothetical protein [Gammaproteobacteria bacterium]